MYIDAFDQIANRKITTQSILDLINSNLILSERVEVAGQDEYSFDFGAFKFAIYLPEGNELNLKKWNLPSMLIIYNFKRLMFRKRIYSHIDDSSAFIVTKHELHTQEDIYHMLLYCIYNLILAILSSDIYTGKYKLHSAILYPLAGEYELFAKMGFITWGSHFQSREVALSKGKFFPIRLGK